jgi:hypothetical protein
MHNLHFLTLILKLAKRKSIERQTEEITETGDNILIQTLLKIVQKDAYYSLKQIRQEMAGVFDDEQRWLSNEWVGRALKRFGFTQKRRVGSGVEYYLTKTAVKDIAERMGIKVNEEKPPIMVSVKEWCTANKDKDGEVLLEQLAHFIKHELQEDPQKVIREAFKQSILMESKNVEKAVVV